MVRGVAFVEPLKTDVEETIKRIQGHKGVLGVVVVNTAGVTIKTTLDNEETAKYAGLITQLAGKARSVVRELDSTVNPFHSLFLLLAERPHLLKDSFKEARDNGRPRYPSNTRSPSRQRLHAHRTPRSFLLTNFPTSREIVHSPVDKGSMFVWFPAFFL
jgi:hypothetical protein